MIVYLKNIKKSLLNTKAKLIYVFTNYAQVSEILFRDINLNCLIRNIRFL